MSNATALVLHDVAIGETRQRRGSNCIKLTSLKQQLWVLRNSIPTWEWRSTIGGLLETSSSDADEEEKKAKTLEECCRFC